MGPTSTLLQLDGETAKVSALRALTLDGSGSFGDILPMSAETALVAWNTYVSVKWTLVPWGAGTKGETDPHVALVWQNTGLQAALLERTP